LADYGNLDILQEEEEGFVPVRRTIGERYGKAEMVPRPLTPNESQTMRLSAQRAVQSPLIVMPPRAAEAEITFVDRPPTTKERINLDISASRARPARPPDRPPKDALYDALSLAYEQAVTVDTEWAAANARLSDQTGIPQWLINEKKSVREAAQRSIKSPALVKMAEEAPITSIFFSDPNNMAMAYDDLDKISIPEAVIRGWKESAAMSSVIKEISNVLLRNGVTEDSLKRIQELTMELANINVGEPSSTFKKWFYTAGQTMEYSLSSVRRGITPAMVAGIAGSVLLSLFPPTAPIGLATAGALTTTQILGAAMGAGFYTGQVQEIFEREFGSSFIQALDNGLTPDTAFTAALITGAVNAGIELSQIETLLRAFPGARQALGAITSQGARKLLQSKSFRSAILKAGKELGVLTGTETLEEIAQNAVENVVTEIARRTSGYEPVGAGDVAKQLLQESAEIVTQFGPAIAITALPGIVSSTISDFNSAAKARRTAEMLRQVNGALAESKAFKRYPQKYAGLIRDIAADGGIDAFYVPVERFNEYFQSISEGNVEMPAEIARQLGIEKQYEEARQTGGKVEIPVDVAIERLAPAGHLGELINDISVHEEDLTQNEAIANLEQLEEKIRGAWQEAQATATADMAKELSALNVKDRVKNQLIGAGVGPQEADTMSELYRARSLAMADLLGITPEQWYDRLGLSIIGQAKVEEAKPKARKKAEAKAVEAEAKPPQAPVIDIEEAYLEELETTREEIDRIQKDIMKVIREEAKLDYRKIADVFGKEEAQKLKAKLGPSAFKKDGMGLDKAAQVISSRNIMQIEGDQELFNILMGEPTRRYEQKERGKIETGRRRIIISLSKEANLSTFLHETGHLFLEDLRRVASLTEAPEQVKQDYRTILNWLGVEEGQELTPEHHETFARGFEAYLMEGKAPTTALQRAFETFKRWLIRIYSSIVNLGVELNDEVRLVMDRMLATEEQIRESEAMAGYEAFLKEIESLGLPDNTVEEYGNTAEQAHIEGWRNLFSRAVKAVKGEYSRLRKEHMAKARSEAEREVMAMPVYNALYRMSMSAKRGGIKLNYYDVLATYGEEAIKALPKRIFSKKGGMSADTAAEFLGYNTGRELIDDIIKAKPRAEAINDLVRQKMQEFDASMQGGPIEAMGSEAVRTPARLDTILAELNILKQIASGIEREKVKLDKAEAARRKKALERAAEASVAGMRPAQLNPQRYFRLEQKAIQEFMKAFEARDYEAAAAAKEKQAVNHAMAMEVIKRKEEINKIVEKMRKIERKPPKLPMAYLEQLDALFAKASFRRLTNKALDQIKPLSEWANEQEADLKVVAIPEALMSADYKKHWKTMTVSELQDFDAAVSNIITLGRQEKRLLAAAKAEEKDAAVAKMVEQAIATGVNMQLKKPERHKSKFAKAIGLIKAFGAMHTKAEFMCKILDDFKQYGPWHDFIYYPMVEAQERENALKQGIYERIGKILSVYSDAEFRQMRNSRIYFPAIDETLTKEDVMCIALNLGSKPNKERMTNPDGPMKWTQEQIDSVVDILDERDWNVVVSIGRLLESYWPEVEKLHIETAGIKPKKKETVPVVTKYGTFEGWYYPIAYDSENHWGAYLLSKKMFHEDFAHNYHGFGMTIQGHLKEAKESTGLPLRFGFDVLLRHIENFTHDLAFRKALIDVRSLLKDEAVQNAIMGAFGLEGYKQFVEWHANIASTRRDMYSPLEHFIKKARYGATVATMSYKISVSLAQLMGFAMSAKEVGAGRLASSLAEFIANPHGMYKFALERSRFLQERKGAFDRDAKDAMDKMVLREGKLRRINEMGIRMIGMFDMLVSIPTWHAAYTKALKEGLSEQEAIRVGDETVRTTQGTGYSYALSNIQQGGELRKLFTMYGSFYNVLYNTLYMEYKYAQLKGLDASRLAATMFYVVGASSLLGELLAGRGPEDDEDKVEWAVMEMLGFLSSSMFLVRDITSYAFLGYQYRFTPAEAAFKSLAELVKEMTDVAWGGWEEEKEIKDVAKAAYKAISYWGPLPMQQMDIALNGLVRLWEDDPDAKIKDLFLKPQTVKKRARGQYRKTTINLM
jgi:hypothetical protein